MCYEDSQLYPSQTQYTVGNFSVQHKVMEKFSAFFS